MKRGINGPYRAWSEREEHLLVKLVGEHGTKWKTINNVLEREHGINDRKRRELCNKWKNMNLAQITSKIKSQSLNREHEHMILKLHETFGDDF